MRKDFFIFLFLVVGATVVFSKSFFNFFAQDDFILISQFSQNAFLDNIKNVFDYPGVTHWRPVHNIYFFLAGTLFGKNYFFYHLLTLILHIVSGFLIFKVVEKVSLSQKAAVSSAFLYTLSYNHFTSLFWISGGATIIGFTFLIASFYSYLCRRNVLSLFFFIVSILASEAMVVGVLIFFAWELLAGKRSRMPKSLALLIAISLVFSAMRLIFLNPGKVSESYSIQLPLSDLSAVKYYVLRVLGFMEGGGMGIVNLGTGTFLTAALLSFTLRYRQIRTRTLIFALVTVFAGLFPFVLIPAHLSAHYVNISLFGFSTAAGIIIGRMNNVVAAFVLGLFFVVNLLAVSTLNGNHWTTQRASLAGAYISRLESQNLPISSKIVFEDNSLSTSKEAYIVLGTGEAIKFWFPDKNYNTCFTFYENCIEK
ncbi:MAG: hypothetical protein WD988_03850 [Candidatus Curtissbacteria bacterium]